MRHLGDRCPLWLALCHLALRFAAKAHRNLATESTFKATATVKRVFRRLCGASPAEYRYEVRRMLQDQRGHAREESLHGSSCCVRECHAEDDAGCSKHGAPLQDDLQDVARLCTRSDVNGDFRRTTRHHEPQAGKAGKDANLRSRSAVRDRRRARCATPVAYFYSACGIPGGDGRPCDFGSSLEQFKFVGDACHIRFASCGKLRASRFARALQRS